jgi:zeta-carotene desaturase
VLAGDYTRTGWPATMEGAARSGYDAAAAVLGVSAESLRPQSLPVAVQLSALGFRPQVG